MMQAAQESSESSGEGLNLLLQHAQEAVGEPVEAVGFFHAEVSGRQAATKNALTVVFALLFLSIVALLAYGTWREGGFKTWPIRYTAGTILFAFLALRWSPAAARAVSDRLGTGSPGAIPRLITLTVSSSKVYVFRWDLPWLPVYAQKTHSHEKIRPAIETWDRAGVRVTDQVGDAFAVQVPGRPQAVRLRAAAGEIHEKEKLLIAAWKAPPLIAVKGGNWEQLVQLLSQR